MSTISVSVDKNSTIIHTKCILCKKKRNIEVLTEDYFKWQRGDLIQKTFPYLNVNDREILISGMCGDCFDEVIDYE